MSGNDWPLRRGEVFLCLSFSLSAGRNERQVNETDNATHEEKDALRHHWMVFLSNRQDGLPDDIFWQAVPIWCEESHDDLAERLGEEYACGFAYGFERGIIMAMLRPEWGQGLYHILRQHYLTTHTDEDPEDWERHADATALAAPIRRMSLETV